MLYGTLPIQISLVYQISKKSFMSLRSLCGVPPYKHKTWSSGCPAKHHQFKIGIWAPRTACLDVKYLPLITKIDVILYPF